MRDEDAKKEEKKFNDELSKRKNIKFEMNFKSETEANEDVPLQIGEPVLKKEDKVTIVNIKKEAKKRK